MRRVQSPSGAEVLVDGRQILNFGGSCYLGLSREPEIVAAGAAALRDQGSLSQLPRHYGFMLGANLDVEAEAKAYFDTEAAIYFATGYLFGLLAIPGLTGDDDVVYMDASGHYNLTDGARAAGRTVITYRHRDAGDLETQIKATLRPGQRPVVATDGMFPTFGTIPPLADYARIIEPYGGLLLVDESHSFGVLGDHGRGAVEREGVAGGRTLSGGSVGKAFSAYGGIAAGSEAMIASLWTAPAARGAANGMSSGAAMAAASMSWLMRHPERLAKLRANVRHFKAGLRALGLEVDDTESPIAAFVCGNAEEMQRIQRLLFEEDMLVFYSTYVGAGPEGAIRSAVFADHEVHQLDCLLEALSRLL